MNNWLKKYWLVLILLGAVTILISMAIPIIDRPGVDYQIRWTVPVFPQEPDCLEYPETRIEDIKTADLNGDDILEIVAVVRIAVARNNVYYKIIVMDQNGNWLPNWPLVTHFQNNRQRSIKDFYSLAIGDINGDGNNDLVMSVRLEQESPGILAYDFQKNAIIALSLNEYVHTDEWRRRTTEIFKGKIILADFLKDEPGVELVACKWPVACLAKFNNIRNVLEVCHVWQIDVEFPPDKFIDFAVGDLSGDGTNIMVACTENGLVWAPQLFAYGFSGTTRVEENRNNINENNKNASFIVLGDIDLNGTKEVVFSPTQSHYIYTLTWGLNDFPQVNRHSFWFTGPGGIVIDGPLCLANLDNEPDLEILKFVTNRGLLSDDEHRDRHMLSIFKLRNSQWTSYTQHFMHHPRVIEDIIVGNIDNAPDRKDVITVEHPIDNPQDRSINVYIDNWEQNTFEISNATNPVLTDINNDGNTELIYSEHTAGYPEIVCLSFQGKGIDWKYRHYNSRNTRCVEHFCLIDSIIESLSSFHANDYDDIYQNTRKGVHEILNADIAKEPLSQEFIKMYWKHGKEIWRIIKDQPYLIDQFWDVIRKTAEHRKEIIGLKPKERNLFTPSNINEINLVAEEIYKSAGKELRKDMKQCILYLSIIKNENAYYGIKKLIKNKKTPIGKPFKTIKKNVKKDISRLLQR